MRNQTEQCFVRSRGACGLVLRDAIVRVSPTHLSLGIRIRARNASLRAVFDLAAGLASRAY